MIIPDTKQRIQKAAHDLVMQYSIRSVSMDDIAANLGMSKKTIYQYFKDKDELVEAVVDDVIITNQCECNADRDKAENAIHEIFLVMDMMAEMFKTMNPSILFDMQKYHPAAFRKFMKHKNEFLYNVCRQNAERGLREELYRPEIAIDILCKYRVETMFIPFNPEFQQGLKHSLAKIQDEIIVHFLFGLVTLKGYELILKYMEQKAKTEIKNDK
ncbi:MAG: TetR/AcrR family transcriptional regulator [Ferruginibacter sp.]|nr:TetR/AcrR family transcriptional regulator [Chitinophagaceae bacterium]MBP6285288.1 TetR/AcrR family transcriptional regulator [Ferruginibacter sp.]MBU9935526.1 TetR/AcrR family transcriptional regulator [Ferruginibacter sp.]